MVLGTIISNTSNSRKFITMTTEDNLKEKYNVVSNERGEIMINYLNTMKEVMNLQMKKIH